MSLPMCIECESRRVPAKQLLYCAACFEERRSERSERRSIASLRSFRSAPAPLPCRNVACALPAAPGRGFCSDACAAACGVFVRCCDAHCSQPCAVMELGSRARFDSAAAAAAAPVKVAVTGRRSAHAMAAAAAAAHKAAPEAWVPRVLRAGKLPADCEAVEVADTCADHLPLAAAWRTVRVRPQAHAHAAAA
jgi:hypothetical protein